MYVSGEREVSGDLVPLITALSNPLAGVLLIYLFWREKNDREDRKRREDRQAEIDKADIESREKLATAMSALSTLIQARPNV